MKFSLGKTIVDLSKKLAFTNPPYSIKLKINKQTIHTRTDDVTQLGYERLQANNQSQRPLRTPPFNNELHIFSSIEDSCLEERRN